jgi:hypothetical protein
MFDFFVEFGALSHMGNPLEPEQRPSLWSRWCCAQKPAA